MIVLPAGARGRVEVEAAGELGAPVHAPVGGGLTNRDVAQALFLTTQTVETHLGHVYRKLGVSGRGELGARLA